MRADYWVPAKAISDKIQEKHNRFFAPAIIVRHAIASIGKIRPKVTPGLVLAFLNSCARDDLQRTILFNELEQTRGEA